MWFILSRIFLCSLYKFNILVPKVGKSGKWHTSVECWLPQYIIQTSCWSHKARCALSQQGQELLCQSLSLSKRKVKSGYSQGFGIWLKAGLSVCAVDRGWDGDWLELGKDLNNTGLGLVNMARFGFWSQEVSKNWGSKQLSKLSF